MLTAAHRQVSSSSPPFVTPHTVPGTFVDDEYDGMVVTELADGSRMEAHFQHGVMHGPAAEFASDGSCIFRGGFSGNVRSGFCKFYYADGGMLCGMANSSGDISASNSSEVNAAYVYPGGQHALIGCWMNDKMERAFYTDNIDLGLFESLLLKGMKSRTVLRTLLTASELSQPFTHDQSTEQHLAHHPMLADPHEQSIVFVSQSTVADAGEGMQSSWC